MQSTSWPQLCAYLGKGTARPFRVVHGMRHEVRTGVCCAVHSHRDLEIVYHPMGSGVTRLEGGRHIRFEPGAVVLYAPRQRHDQVMDEAGRDDCLQIEIPAALRSKLKGALYLPPPIDPLVVAEIEALTSDRGWPEASERAVLHLRATTVLLSLLETASAIGRRREMPRRERHVAKAETYLRTHFQNIASMPEAARHVGISHDRLRHLFQEYRGITLIGFLNQLKLDRARSLLIHSRLPLKQVAALSGFRDEYYFSAVFRRHHQLAPGAYRAKHEES